MLSCATVIGHGVLKQYGSSEVKIKLSRIFATVLAMAVATAAYGTDYYVDANNGDNGWDGTTATIPTAEQVEALTQAGEPIPGPRKTLHAMMSDSRVAVGDTVWAAEGDYNAGRVFRGVRRGLLAYA